YWHERASASSSNCTTSKRPAGVLAFLDSIGHGIMWKLLYRETSRSVYYLQFPHHRVGSTLQRSPDTVVRLVQCYRKTGANRFCSFGAGGIGAADGIPWLG